MNWPLTDEANYLLEVRNITHGMLPYRDFYDFITPGGQLLGALFCGINGFSILGLRLLVMFGWLLEIMLLVEMGKAHLSRGWLILLGIFLWLTDSRYPVYQHHFWSGLTALCAVFLAWQALQNVYAGKRDCRPLVFSGLLAAATFWFTQSLGVFITLAMLVFSGLHVFLHERETQNVSYQKVDQKQVFRRWLREWGINWGLPFLAFHAACVFTLMAFGIGDDFLRDAIGWLAGGHYQKTTVIGYYTTFAEEFKDTIRPFIDQVAMPYLLVYLFRIPIAFHLFLIGMLPIIGILGQGYWLPARFHYRLLRREDESLLLLWIAAVALIASTLSYSTSMHLVSNAGIPLLLGWIVLARWASRQPRRNRDMGIITAIFCTMLLLGAVAGSLIQVFFGSWLPRMPGLDTPLVYTEFQTNAHQFMTVLKVLSEAPERGESIYVLNETPSIYLAGPFRNATRFTLTIPLYTTPAQIREIMADLERNRPLYIVDDQTTLYLPQDNRFAHAKPEELHLPAIDQYVKAHYSLKAALGRYRVYERKQGYFD